MTTENHSSEGFDRVKSVLSSGPQQGWVFGVCSHLAQRTGWELWAIRSVMLVCLLVMSLLTIFGYFVLAMLMNETRPGAQVKMRRWAGQMDKVFDVVSAGVKRFFAQQRNANRSDKSGGWRQDYSA